MKTSRSTDTGPRADLARWDIAQPAELAYAFGANPCVGRLRAVSSPQPKTSHCCVT